MQPIFKEQQISLTTTIQVAREKKGERTESKEKTDTRAKSELKRVAEVENQAPFAKKRKVDRVKGSEFGDASSEIMRKIELSETFSELKWLWESKHKEFDLPSYISFGSHLSKTLRSHEKNSRLSESEIELIREFCKQGVSKVASMDEPKLAILAKALRFLNPPNKELFKEIQKEFLKNEEKKLSSCFAKNLATLADATIELEDTPTPFMQAIRKQFVKTDSEAIRFAKADDFAQIARAFSKLSEPPKDLFEAIQEKILKKNLLNKCDSWVWVNLAEAFCKVKGIPQKLLQMMATECSKGDLVQKCNIKECGMLANALGKLESDAEMKENKSRALLAIAKELSLCSKPTQEVCIAISLLLDSMASLKTQSFGFASILPKLTAHIENNVATLAPINIVMCLKFYTQAPGYEKTVALLQNELMNHGGLLKLNGNAIVTISESIHSAVKKDQAVATEHQPFFLACQKELLEKNATKLKELQPHALTLAAESFARQGEELLPVLKEIKSQLTLQDRIKSCSLEGLAHTAVAYSRFDCFKQSDIFKKISERLLEYSQEEFLAMDPNLIVKFVHAFTRANFLNFTLFKRFASAIQKCDIQRFALKDLSDLTWGFARSTAHSPALFQLLEKPLLSVMKETKAITPKNWDHLFLAVWAFACSGYVESSIFKTFFTVINLKNELSRANSYRLLQIIHSIHLEHKEAKSLLTQELIEWQREAIMTFSKEHVDSSEFHQAVFKVLGNYYPKIQKEVPIRGLIADCLIEDERAQQTVVEVNGPTHYLDDGQTLTGDSLFKMRLVQKMGYPVVPLSGDQWGNILRAPDLKAAFEAHRNST